MTAVEITFRYQGRLHPELLARTQEQHENFGIRRIQLDEAQQRITVEYDATRLDEKGVEAVLRRAGVPVVEQFM
jgi:hypothetical protein